MKFKFFIVFLFFGLFFLPILSSMSFKFNLDKNNLEPGEIIDGNGVFDIENESFPLELELRVFLNEETFRNSVLFSENITFHSFRLSEYFENLVSPLEGGEYDFNFTVSKGVASFEYSSVIIIPFKIVSYSPEEDVMGDSVTLEIVTNKNAECRYSLNSSLNYSLMGVFGGDGLNHLVELDIEEEKVYEVYVECNDSYSIVNESFSFRKIIPLTISNLWPKGYISTESPEISFRTNKIAICKYSDKNEVFLLMDGMDSTNDTLHYKELEGLNTGRYTYYIECHDFYGQSSTNEISFNIDKENPSISLHEPNGVINYNDTINFTYTPKDDYGLRYCELYINLSDGWEREEYDSSILNNKLNSFIIKNLNLAPKPHYWKVKCVDYAGNSVEGNKLSFTMREIPNSGSSSWDSADSSGSAGSASLPNSSTKPVEVENPEDFNESKIIGGFITGAAISNFGSKVKNFFSPFIFIITILALFMVVGIHQYTKKEKIGILTIPIFLHKLFNPKRIQHQGMGEDRKGNGRGYVKQKSNLPRENFPQENQSQRIKLENNKVHNLNESGLRKIIDKDNLVDHFHWRILMTRRRKHISRDKFAKTLGISEMKLRMIEEGFLPEDSSHLITKIEHYLRINLRK